MHSPYSSRMTETPSKSQLETPKDYWSVHFFPSDEEREKEATPNSPPVVSLPWQSLQIFSGVNDSAALAAEEISDYSVYMSPQQVLDMHEKGLDYICGVSDGINVCKQSIYCRLHSFGERASVERSRTLSELILDEAERPSWFRNQQELAVSFHSCKSLLSIYDKNWVPKTCDNTSCNESRSLLNSPCTLLARPTTAHGIIPLDIDMEHYSRKSFFMFNLALNAATEMEDIVSYLHYKLECYQNVDLDVRARELEVQSDPYRSTPSPGCRIT